MQTNYEEVVKKAALRFDGCIGIATGWAEPHSDSIKAIKEIFNLTDVNGTPLSEIIKRELKGGITAEEANHFLDWSAEADCPICEGLVPKLKAIADKENQ